MQRRKGRNWFEECSSSNFITDSYKREQRGGEGKRDGRKEGKEKRRAREEGSKKGKREMEGRRKAKVRGRERGMDGRKARRKSGQYRGPRQNFVLTVFFLCLYWIIKYC